MDTQQHIRPQIKPEPVYNGHWNLPSVRDILHAPPSQPEMSARSPAILAPPLCSTCMSRDRKVQLRPDRSCPHCTPEQSFPSAQQGPRHLPESSAALLRTTGGSDIGRRPTGLYVPHSGATHPTHTTIQTPLASPLTPNTSSPGFSLGHRPSLPCLPSRSQNPAALQGQPRGLSTGAQPISAAKKASNDRHKLSEKHRRDGQLSYVRAGYEMRAGLDPGILSGCQICMADSSSRRGSSAFCSTTLGSLSDDNAARSVSPPNGVCASGPGGKLKIPKNDMLEEGLMWEFSFLLHTRPHEIADRLDRIRILAQRMEADKAFGLQSDWPRRKKWDADVRGEVLMLTVAKMEEECQRHGIDVWASGASQSEPAEAQRKRQRDSVDADDDMASRFMKRRDVPTPPSSRGSREGSASADDRQQYR